MVKKLKSLSNEQDKQLANAVRNSAQQIWQAGLGAFAKAQEEGGKVFSRLELLQATQGACYAGYERTIDVHIMNLRQKIKQIDPDTVYIQTIFGQGYRALG